MELDQLLDLMVEAETEMRSTSDDEKLKPEFWDRMAERCGRISEFVPTVVKSLAEKKKADSLSATYQAEMRKASPDTVKLDEIIDEVMKKPANTENMTRQDKLKMKLMVSQMPEEFK